AKAEGGRDHNHASLAQTTPIQTKRREERMKVSTSSSDPLEGARSAKKEAIRIVPMLETFINDPETLDNKVVNISWK
ncbi:MAG: hypothetical protein AABY13_00185, partial [Nanoarchaeota archaeon]